MSVDLNWENQDFWEGALVVKKDEWPDGTKKEHIALEVPINIEDMALKATKKIGGDQTIPYVSE